MRISVCFLLARSWQLPEVLLVVAALRDMFAALGVLAKLCAAQDGDDLAHRRLKLRTFG